MIEKFYWMVRKGQLPLWATLTAAVVLVGFAAGGIKTYNYVQHSPEFCTNCHIMTDAFDKWQASVHSKVTCHACHAPDLGSNLRQLYVYWTNPPNKPTHAPELENGVCYGCHRVESDPSDKAALVDRKWEHVLASAGHAEHVVKQKIQCVRCHSTSLHKFVPPSELCKSCHKHEAMVGSAMDQHCTQCHNYTAVDRENLLPARKDCLACHEDMQVAEEIFPEANGELNAPMQWACGKCHKPHTKHIPTRDDCAGCHQEKLSGSDLHGVEAHKNCLQCHKPHLWKVKAPATCLECHDTAAVKEHSEGEVCTECHE